MIHNLTIQYEWSVDGWWVAEIAEIPGAMSQGKTKAEARTNVLDALTELMKARREDALSTTVDPSNIETIGLHAKSQPLSSQRLALIA